MHLWPNCAVPATPAACSPRAPWRPNLIGISVVRLKRVRGRFLEVSRVDMVADTPLLDIKLYIPELPKRGHVKLGWLERVLPEK